VRDTIKQTLPKKYIKIDGMPQRLLGVSRMSASEGIRNSYESSLVTVIKVLINIWRNIYADIT
jgi:hypothetical protein